jgi:DNA (cytosine-5)-methyltransferase 3A
MLAFPGLNIKVDNYYAYEIDKYAIQTTQHNFPNVKELGDVFEADFSKYKDIDFLVGGSPCTYWSIAQKNDSREVKASGIGWGLFSQYVRALREVKPKAFLYENNKSMSKAIYESISETFGFEPIMIDSALVSAQSRKRYYWCGILQDDGSYRKANINQPEDRGIILRDIINADREKSRAIIGSIGRTTTREYFKKHQGQMAFEPVGTSNNKSYCVTATYGATGVAEPLSPKQVGSLPRPNGELSTSQAFRVYDIDHKSVGLKANGGGAGGKTGLYAIPVEFDNDKPIKAVSATDGKTYPVYCINEGQIEIKGKLYPIKLNDGYYIIRKLTVDECKMLQTVPDWYEFPVSDSQSYKMLGNGWTVEVIKHLLSGIINDI